MVKDGKGKALLPEEKKYIILLRDYFERNRDEFGTEDSSSQRVADALNIGLATVNRIMANYNKDPDSINKNSPYRGRPSYAVNTSLQEIVRTFIREANLAGKYVTLDTIREYLQEHSPDEFHISTLGRTLDRWGFEYGKGTRTQHLKEKDYVIAARQRYLRKMRANRLNSEGKTIRQEVYLDESYINKNHSNDYTRKTGDYHGQMNWDIFKKWFLEKLLPNIPESSLIIMDNAPYHKVLSENSAPTAASSKENIQKWLGDNKISYSSDCLKAELIDMLLKIVPAPTYAIDEIAKQYGHEVIRTPPYHPELQPIEICWGVLKNEVGRHCDFSVSNLQTQLELAFQKVTTHTCAEIIKKTKKIEDKFWHDDVLLENMLYS